MEDYLYEMRDKIDLKGLNVLVTGGAGFIGSWLSEALIDLGCRVTCIDNLSTGLLDNIKHLLDHKDFKFVNADVSTKPLEINNIDIVLHLASRASPEDYQRYPIDTLNANSLGSYKMLELARKNDAKILYTSTSEVYGDAKVIPTPEDYWGYVNPIGIRSCYDEGKRFSEALFMAYHRQYGLDTRIVRIFNTYGPRLRADGSYARVISRFIIQALSNKDITVYGDGNQTRSFCYITDTINAILLALTNDSIKGDVINIGNPQEVKIIDLAEMIIKMADSRSKIVFLPKREDDPYRRCPDISKAKRLLGWMPRIRLEDGLLKTIKTY